MAFSYMPLILFAPFNIFYVNNSTSNFCAIFVPQNDLGIVFINDIIILIVNRFIEYSSMAVVLRKMLRAIIHTLNSFNFAQC